MIIHFLFHVQEFNDAILFHLQEFLTNVSTLENIKAPTLH